MKAIARLLYNNPVVDLLVINGVVSALAAEGQISGWIAVVTLAATAPILRAVVTPVKKK